MISGATYVITVQSLPSGHGNKHYTRNWVRKNISIPNWKGTQLVLREKV